MSSIVTQVTSWSRNKNHVWFDRFAARFIYERSRKLMVCYIFSDIDQVCGEAPAAASVELAARFVSKPCSQAYLWHLIVRSGLSRSFSFTFLKTEVRKYENGLLKTVLRARFQSIIHLFTFYSICHLYSLSAVMLRAAT